MTAALCSRRVVLIGCTARQVWLAGSYSSAAVMPLQHPPALPPARSTRSPLSKVAGWSDRAVARFPTAVHDPAAGSQSSAEAVDAAPLNVPPATRTGASLSGVAVCHACGARRAPVIVHCPDAGAH